MKIISKPANRHHISVYFSIIAALYFFSSCSQSQSQPGSLPSATPLLQPENSPSPTIVWFPATATATVTPPPIPTATQVSLSGIGPSVKVDSFTSTKFWSGTQLVGTDDPNRMIISDSALVFALNQSPVRAASLNSEVFLSDAYVRVQVDLNRCSVDDFYGVLFKATNEKLGNRLIFNCNGEMRLEQLRENLITPLTDWLSGGDVPLGAPGNVLIGIWSSGSEIRVFLNDHYQFTVFDSYYKNGGVGVFANSSSEAGMNVRFSNIMINTVDYSSPTPTLKPSSTPFHKANSTTAVP